MSYNWNNYASQTDDPVLTGYGSPGRMLLTTYYNASTGYLSSGLATVATYQYTVPWQTYQFNPGATINQQVGQTLTQQVVSGYNLNPGPGGGGAVTLPANMTIPGGAASGYVQEVATVGDYPTDTNVRGFTTTAWNPSGGDFLDGASGNNVRDIAPGVFYNYSTNVTSSGARRAQLPQRRLAIPSTQVAPATTR